MKMKMIFVMLIGLSSLSLSEFTTINGVVIDSTTKLTWQNGNIKLATWVDAINYCENELKLDDGGWRLPNIKELASLVDDTKYNPSINYHFDFVLIQDHGVYWSSTTRGEYYGDDGGGAFTIDFVDGNLGVATKLGERLVRCVKN